MLTVPKFISPSNASSVLNAFIICDSQTLTDCYLNAKLSFSLKQKCTLQYVTTHG